MAVFAKFRVRARRHTAVLATAALVAGVLGSMVSVQPALAAPGDITTVSQARWGVDWAGGQLYTSGDTEPPVVLGDGRPATEVVLSPTRIVVDATGNLYILAACRVRKVDHATGIITTVAGTGDDCGNGVYSGEGGLATAATFSPLDIAIDGVGDLYLTIDASSGGRILKVDHVTGLITTVAGGGTPADGLGDGGPATAANLDRPIAVALDPAGNIFVSAGGRIRRIDHTTGVITTLAVIGATLGFPEALTFGNGSLFVAATTDSGHDTVFKVNPTSGRAVVVAGGGSPADGIGDGGPAVAATVGRVNGLAFRAGLLYISDLDTNRVRKVDLRTGIITTAAGTGIAGDRGDGLLATQAQLFGPTGLAFDAAGDLFVVNSNSVDQGTGRVRRIDQATGIITTVAGGGIGDGGPFSQAKLTFARGILVDPSGNILIADCGHHRVRKVTPGFGTITTIAGGGTPADGLGDNGPATGAVLDCPSGLALVTSGVNAGTLYIADAGSNRVRKVDLNGIISTVVGTGIAGVGGDGGPASAAQLNGPSDVAVDSTGQLFIADTANNRVRKVDAAGVISTLAGDGIAEFGLDGIKATQSHVVKPTGVTLDGHGHLVIAEMGFARIRQVDLATGIITTIAGTGIPGFTGDGGPATLAELSAPTKVAFDPAGNMYIADSGNGRTRRVEPGTTPSPTKGCGAVITKTTKLHADIGPCPLDGIVIGADKITLDLNGHQILGVGHTSDAGDSSPAAGIRLPNRRAVTITGASKAGGPQGSVSGFQEGVAIIGGSGNTVTNVNIHDNIGPITEAATFGDGIGIFFSSRNRIIGNQIVHNGIYDGIGVLGVGSDHNLIQNNTITNTFSGEPDCGCGGAGEGTGIVLNPFLDVGLPRMVSIYGNQMIGNTVSNNNNSGITNISNVNSMIKNNVVENNGIVPGGPFGGGLNSPANGIGVSNLGFATGSTNVLVQSNQVHGNGRNGITVASSGNRILNNNAANNHVFGNATYDLSDANGNPLCPNVWNNNTYGPPPLGFEVGCETAGGHEVPGPAPADSAKAPAVQARPAPNDSLSNPAPRGHPANPAG